MRSHVRVFLIAIFITASYRLVPLPIGDTMRAAFFAAGASLFCTVQNGRMNIAFLKEAWPLFALICIVILFDVMLGRIGVHSSVVWVRLLTALMIASAVYSMSLKEVQRLVVVSMIILFAQLALISFYPGYFVSAARDLGIVDPFVTYGRELERVYYSYFNANAAAYAIFYMMLSFIALRQADIQSSSLSFIVITALIILAILTGSRGVVVLIVGFAVVWFASFRSTAAALFAGTLLIGPAMALPLYNATVAFILLREESNFARLEAMQTYIGFIGENPMFGVGIQSLRERVEVEGMHPSHNFYLEILAMFGLVFGGALAMYLIYKLVVGIKSRPLRIIGVFALLVGVFNNTLLANWGFLPLLFPTLILADKARRQITASGSDSSTGTMRIV